MEESPDQHHEAEIIPEAFSETISDSVFKKFFLEVSSVTIFTLRFFKEAIKPPYEINEVMKQSFLIGYKSLPLVAITGFIIGLVLTIQTRPTLGKFGSGIGAELASMNVTEQIDAMQVSDTNPFKYLVVTRVLSATLMLPILVIFGDGVGLLGSLVGVNIKGNVSSYLFFSQIFQSLDFQDVIPAVIKTFFFGFAIGLIGSYKGYNSNKGTEGVGKAANSAVVLASLIVFIIDMIAVQITSVLQN